MPKGNVNEIGFLLLQQLGVKVIRTTFDLELESHPEYPALSALVDTYFFFGVNNLVAELSVEHLATIPLPAIVHMEDNEEQYFVIVKEVGSAKVYYTGHKNSLEKEAIAEFSKKWTGFVLLAEANVGAGSFFLMKANN